MTNLPSLEHIELAKHAIGLDYKKPYKRHGKLFYKPYRNYFATGGGVDNSPWLDLCGLGYAKHRAINSHGSYTFWLTRKGLDWLGKALNMTIYDMEA